MEVILVETRLSSLRKSAIESASLYVLIVVAAMLTSSVVRAAERAQDPDPKSPVFESETPDDPPGVYDAREDRLARSQGLAVPFGSYLSIQVNVDGLGLNIVGDAANEPSISVNPMNPLNMVVGWRQFNTVTSNFRQAGWAYTFDGGQHWTFPGVLEPIFRSDPVLDADAHGTFFYQSLKGDFTADVFRSTDGGVTWDKPVAEWGGDKNWMVVDRSGGIGDGNVYGIWQRFASCCDTNVLTRSTDGGAGFASPVAVAFSPTFGTLAVGPDGELYATGIDGTSSQDFTHFVVSKSTDARNPGISPTFTGRRVVLGGNMRLSTGPNPGGLLGQPNVAVNRSPGGARGQVYVVSSVGPVGGDPLEVRAIRSSDGGATWSAPVRVNDDLSSSNWQWMAAHSVAPNGRLDVIWNDTRNSGSASISQLFYSYSWDGGATWAPNVAVSPLFNSMVGFPQQNKIGDYSTLVSNTAGADATYCATFNGEQDIYYVNVFPDCNGNGRSDVTDIASASSFDCDENHVPDECQASPTCIGAGGVPASGTPLTVTKIGGGNLRLSWGSSCQSGDTDYEIYEGALGSFTSHVSRFCSTSGATTKSFAPAGGNTYYLVVPNRSGREGSYGQKTGGIERPPAAIPCFPQVIHSCGP